MVYFRWSLFLDKVIDDGCSLKGDGTLPLFSRSILGGRVLKLEVVGDFSWWKGCTVSVLSGHCPGLSLGDVRVKTGCLHIDLTKLR